MPVVKADELKRLCSSTLQKVGVPQGEAEIVSDNLIKANLRGVDSHGIFFLPRLVTKVLNGTIKPGAEIRVLNETPSAALIDGEHGFGQVVGVKAMNMAIEKAKPVVLARSLLAVLITLAWPLITRCSLLIMT